MFTRYLLMAIAAAEVGAGVGLLALPSWTADLLLGESLTSPLTLVLARVAGVALTSLGVACWLGKKDPGGNAQGALIAGMLVYNVGVSFVLVHAWIAWNLHGVVLWPASGLHALLAAGCAVSLWARQ
jgi:hypothetical protein